MEILVMTAQKKFRHLIGEACNRQGLGLGGLAVLIGCSTASIYRWYKGENTPKTRFVIALAKAAGISNISDYLA